MKDHVIITVHGTFVADDDDWGDAWWQRGSQFDAQLQDYFGIEGEESIIEPFHWTSENSASDRRKASKDLCERMLALEVAEQPYSLIGHSHGGSVILDALSYPQLGPVELILDDWRSIFRGPRQSVLRKMRKTVFPNMVSFSTVGTPFISFQAKRASMKSMSRSLVRWKIPVLTLAIIVPMLILANLPEDLRNGIYVTEAFYIAKRDTSLFVFGSFFLVSLALVVLLTLFSRPQRLRRQARKRLQNQLAPRWLCLWHKEDEVLIGLSVAPHVNMALAGGFRPSGLIKGIFLFGLPFLFGGIMLGLTELIDSKMFPQLTVELSVLPDLGPLALLQNFIPYTRESPGGLFYYFLRLTAYWLVVSFVLFWAFKVLLDPVFKKFVGPWIDKWVIRKLQRHAYGSDVLAERVTQTGPKPQFFANGWQSLPDRVAGDIVELVDRNAGKTLSKVRGVLGASYFAKGSANVISGVASQLMGNELVHTSYFDVASAVKVLAYGMSHTASGRAPEGLRNDPELVKTVASFNEIRPV